MNIDGNAGHGSPSEYRSSQTSTQDALRAVEQQLHDHRRKYMRVTGILIEKLRDMCSYRFLEQNADGECNYCSLFEIVAHNLCNAHPSSASRVSDGAAGSDGPVETQLYGLSVSMDQQMIALDDSNRPVPYALTLRPASPSARLVLPTQTSTAVVQDDEPMVVFTVDLRMHLTLPVNGGASKPRMQSLAPGASSMLNVQQQMSSVLSGAVPVRDVDLLRSGEHVAQNMFDCSTSGVAIKFVVQHVAVDGRNRTRPIALLHSVVFSAESILTSDAMPRWPLYIARCLQPRIPKLYETLFANYKAVRKLLDMQEQLRFSMLHTSSASCTRNTSAPSVLPYQLHTLRPFEPASSRYHSAERRELYSRRHGDRASVEDDTSCVIS